MRAVEESGARHRPNRLGASRGRPVSVREICDSEATELRLEKRGRILKVGLRNEQLKDVLPAVIDAYRGPFDCEGRPRRRSASCLLRNMDVLALVRVPGPQLGAASVGVKLQPFVVRRGPENARQQPRIPGFSQLCPSNWD